MAKTNFDEVQAEKLHLDGRSTVTQTTAANNAVTINAASGSITTVAQNIAAGAEVQFVVNNSTVDSTDVPVVALASGSSGGLCQVVVCAVANGSFNILISNTDASIAQIGTLVINFAVIKSTT